MKFSRASSSVGFGGTGPAKSIGDLARREQRRDTHRAVGDAEEAAQGGLADVETAEDDLLAQQGQRHGEVGGAERLTLTRRR